MEILATAILTAVFTGLLLFYFQRRIENSFAEKIEQFKTDLQKELIEHQTKFSTTYPKALEVLEIGYQKLSALPRMISDFHSQLSKSNQPLDPKKIGEMRSEILNACFEYAKYIDDNRRYIPIEIITELEKSHQKAFNLGFASTILLFGEDKSLDSIINQLDSVFILLDKPIEILKESLKVDDEKSKWMFYLRLVATVSNEFELLKEDFNKLYKSVSGG